MAVLLPNCESQLCVSPPQSWRKWTSEPKFSCVVPLPPILPCKSKIYNIVPEPRGGSVEIVTHRFKCSRSPIIGYQHIKISNFFLKAAQPDTGAIPMTDVTALRAGEQVVWLAWVEDHLTKRRLVGGEKSGRVRRVPEVPNCKHAITSTRHQDVRLCRMS